MLRGLIGATFWSISVSLAGAGDPIPADFKKALENAKSLELYSLDPSTPTKKGDANFHDWKILGKTEVKNEALKKLVTAFKRGAAEQNQNISAGCFRPRHGIRAQYKGKTHDFVICFECIAVMLYLDKDKKSTGGFGVSRSPAPVFNHILTDAKVQLPKQPD
jgi:hypothetical protein